MEPNPKLLDNLPVVLRDETGELGVFRGEPVFYGRGGSQLVYAIPGLDGVFKVDYHTLDDPDINGNAASSIGPMQDIDNKLWIKIGLRRQILHTFQHLHGRDHTLNERLYFTSLYITGKMCRALWGTAPYSDTQGRWFRTFVTRQDEAAQLADRDRYQTMSINIQPAEKSNTIHMDAYADACNRWLALRETAWRPEDWELFAAVDGPQILEIRDRSEDTNFRRAFIPFLEASYNFSDMTGQHTDIGGVDNIILHLKTPQTQGEAGNTELTYTCIDGLACTEVDSLSLAGNGFRSFLRSRDKRIERENHMWLYNTLSHHRFFNAMFQAFDLPYRMTHFQNEPQRLFTWRSLYEFCKSLPLKGRNFPTQYIDYGDSSTNSGQF